MQSKVHKGIYNIAFVNSERWLAKSRVDITLCQHRKFPATLLLKFFVLYYKRNIKHFFLIDIQFYNIAFVNSERWLAKSRVDITLCQHRKFPATLLLKFFVLYYKRNIKHFFLIDIQFYNIAFVNYERWLAKSRVDITLCQHRKFPATLLLKFFVLYYKRNIKHFFLIDIQFYNIAFVNSERWLAKSRVDITLCQHRKFPATLLLKFFVLYYKRNIKLFFRIDIQFYNIAFVNYERWLAKSRVDITLSTQKISRHSSVEVLCAIL